MIDARERGGKQGDRVFEWVEAGPHGTRGGTNHRQEHKYFIHSKGKNGGGQGYRCWKVLVARQDGHRSSLLTASIFSENTRVEVRGQRKWHEREEERRNGLGNNLTN